MTEAEYKELKEAHDEARQAGDEARGALKTLQEQLSKNHGLSSVEKAQAKLKELRREEQALEKRLDSAVEAYKKEFPDE